ncbi:MAG: RIP metalloprotease RseP [Dongiaceae bacterium]
MSFDFSALLPGLAQGVWGYFIPFVLVLTILVFVHEWGHYFIARLCGVRVEIFSIGFGREIFGWNDSHGTRWKFSLIPLGGYVKMFGDMDVASSRANQRDYSEEEKKVAFPFKTTGQRAAIVAAGPLANFLFALVVLAGLFMAVGQPFTAPVVDKVIPNSAASKAGVLPGDRIITIDGSAVERFEQIQRWVQRSPGEQMLFDILRKEKMIQLKIVPEVGELTDRFGGKHQIGKMGISSGKVDYIKHGLGGALVQSVKETYDICAATLKAVGQMIMGLRSADDLGGPLRIAEMSGKAAQEDIAMLFMLMAMLSINLGLLNLFPIPLLDGGHLVFYAVEMVRGKPADHRLQTLSSMVGLALVLMLMVFATWNDLVHLNVVSYVKSLFS